MKISEMLLKIWENQEETRESVSEIKTTLLVQQSILEEHQRRSLANEEAVELLRQHIKPIEEHVIMVNTVVKVALAIGGIIGVIATLLSIVQFFIKS